MTARTRLALIGGFLGSGKTTLINKLAERFIDDRKRIGIITNDQGKYLIDTEFVKVHGIDVARSGEKLVGLRIHASKVLGNLKSAVCSKF